jgi:hypothetical protein
VTFQERIDSRRSGLCLCPAHEDSSPSMNVTFAGHKTLVYCFVGCSMPEILSATGLEWTDFFDHGSRPNWRPSGRINYLRIVKEWRDKELTEVCKSLRGRDAMAASVGEEDIDAWVVLALCYDGYSQLEHDFERLNSRSTLDWQEVYEERGHPSGSL